MIQVGRFLKYMHNWLLSSVFAGGMSLGMIADASSDEVKWLSYVNVPVPAEMQVSMEKDSPLKLNISASVQEAIESLPAKKSVEDKVKEESVQPMEPARVKAEPHKKAISFDSVPILMYHEFNDPSEYGPRYTVSADVFRRQLRWLNDNDYVSISLEDYVNGDFSRIPSDKRPVALTFDDSTPGQLRYLPDDTVDPDCAVGVMMDFYKHNPEFGLNGTFYVDFVDKSGDHQVPFGQSGLEDEKLLFLAELGFEIGNHTLEHVRMRREGSRKVKNSIFFAGYMVSLLAPGLEMKSIAYPTGEIPVKGDKTAYVHDHDFAVAAWGGRAPLPGSKRFDRYKIPRIEINNDLKNLETYVK